MTARRPLIVGEILYDGFESGNRVLGGAPFNVAWNLKGLGLDPLLVSSIGNDEDGLRAIEAMKEWGLDRSAVSFSDRPTGSVQVTIRSGEPFYQIFDDQAYDDIRSLDNKFDRDLFSLVYHGSLAFRSSRNLERLARLQKRLDLPRFVDINVRHPWYSQDVAREMFQGAAWVKLNQSELSLVTGLDCSRKQEILNAAKTLKRQFEIGSLLITCGSEGVYALTTCEDFVFEPSPKLSAITDTVGAGDAFAAAAIAGINRGHQIDTILRAAVTFAAKTCTIEGATTTDRAHYEINQDVKIEPLQSN